MTVSLDLYSRASDVLRNIDLLIVKDPEPNLDLMSARDALKRYRDHVQPEMKDRIYRKEQ